MRIMKSVSFKNLVSFIIVMLCMGTSAEMIWNVSLLRKVWLMENVCRVGFDAVEEVIINCVEQFGDGRDVIATIAKPFHTTR